MQLLINIRSVKYMKVLNWNLLCNNKNQVKSLSYIMSTSPEVVCLQEVRSDTLQYLRKQSMYQFFIARDFITKTHFHCHEAYFLVILVKKGILVKAHHIRHIPHLTQHSIWDKIMRWTETLDYQWVELLIEKKLYQVINVHLEVGAGPNLRQKQFNHIVENRNKTDNLIICGDFNLFGRWYISPIVGWGMGFSVPEMLLNERAMFEQLFLNYGLQNVFRNQVTFPFFRLQLDHILVDKNLTIGTNLVYPYTFLSDHRPLEVKISNDKEK